MSEEHKKDGSVTIYLYLPFETEGGRCEAVTLMPWRWDHTMRYREGKMGTPLEMLSEFTGLPDTTLRNLRHVDVERVLKQFAMLMPDEIRNGDGPRAPEPPVEIPLEPPPPPEDQQFDAAAHEPYTPPPEHPVHQDHLEQSQDAGLGFNTDEMPGDKR